jgi:hypothetical protein
MLVNLINAIGLVFATTLIHSLCTIGVLLWFRPGSESSRVPTNPLAGTMTITLLVLLMSFAALLESGLWAGFYVWSGALPDFRDAIYFSLVTFTTLGYGDIVLDEQGRLIAAFQAANGIIMFGWTTAIIVASVQRVFRSGQVEDQLAKAER